MKAKSKDKALASPAGATTYRIAGHRTNEDWNKLDLSEVNNNAAWKKAAEIFETRITKRFLDPIQALIDVDRAHYEKLKSEKKKKAEIVEEQHTFGFAIMCLDCMLIETLQGAKDGLANHEVKSRQLFQKFIGQTIDTKLIENQKKDDIKKAIQNDFYHKVRCELMHCGATGHKFSIHAEDGTKMLEESDGVIRINRTLFHEYIKEEFGLYMKELNCTTSMGNRDKYRENLKKVMDEVCGKRESQS